MESTHTHAPVASRKSHGRRRAGPTGACNHAAMHMTGARRDPQHASKQASRKRCLRVPHTRHAKRTAEAAQQIQLGSYKHRHIYSTLPSDGRRESGRPNDGRRSIRRAENGRDGGAGSALTTTMSS
mmetsp:Transcript_22373/g.55144  ORF Transcript_22373/g.55144 Transcript_22373/m.55144 type:complete len:126 (+) Transcript_22373:247-624(+)